MEDFSLNYLLNNLSKFSNIIFYQKLVRTYVKTYGTQELDKAVRNNNIFLIKTLHSYGADIYFQYNFLLRYACMSGFLEIVKFLIEKGADIHILDDYPLRLACTCGHLEIVKLLVTHGANITDGIMQSAHPIVKQFLINSQKTSYYGIVSNTKLEINLPELEEIIKDNKYYYVFKCQYNDDGFILPDENKKNMLSVIGKVGIFSSLL